MLSPLLGLSMALLSKEKSQKHLHPCGLHTTNILNIFHNLKKWISVHLWPILLGKKAKEILPGEYSYTHNLTFLCMCDLWAVYKLRHNYGQFLTPSPLFVVSNLWMVNRSSWKANDLYRYDPKPGQSMSGLFGVRYSDVERKCVPVKKPAF